MKKSEAIDQLAGYLSTYVWYEKQHPSDLVDLASHAINGIEKIGMLPPVSYKTVPDNTPRVIGKLGDHDIVSAVQYYKQVAISEWEPENE